MPWGSDLVMGRPASVRWPGEQRKARLGIAVEAPIPARSALGRCGFFDADESADLVENVVEVPEGESRADASQRKTRDGGTTGDHGQLQQPPRGAELSCPDVALAMAHVQVQLRRHRRHMPWQPHV